MVDKICIHLNKYKTTHKTILLMLNITGAKPLKREILQLRSVSHEIVRFSKEHFNRQGFFTKHLV